MYLPDVSPDVFWPVEALDAMRTSAWLGLIRSVRSFEMLAQFTHQFVLVSTFVVCAFVKFVIPSFESLLLGALAAASNQAIIVDLEKFGALSFQ